MRTDLLICGRLHPLVGIGPNPEQDPYVDNMPVYGATRSGQRNCSYASEYYNVCMLIGDAQGEVNFLSKNEAKMNKI